MTKKKAQNAPQSAEVVSEIIQPEPQPKLYMPRNWKGVKVVYQCLTCQTFRDDEDVMIEHVLTHVPIEKQNETLNQLLQENK